MCMHSAESWECISNRVNVFLKEVLHCLVILRSVYQWPHCADCSCVQCYTAQPASNLVSAVYSTKVNTAVLLWCF